MDKIPPPTHIGPNHPVFKHRIPGQSPQEDNDPFSIPKASIPTGAIFDPILPTDEAIAPNKPPEEK